MSTTPDLKGLKKRFFVVRNEYTTPYIGNTPYVRQGKDDSTLTYEIEVRVIGSFKRNYPYKFQLGDLPMIITFAEKVKLEFHIKVEMEGTPLWAPRNLDQNGLLPKGIILIEGADPGYTEKEREQIRLQKLKRRKPSKREKIEFRQGVLAEAEKAGITKEIAEKIIDDDEGSVITLKGVIALKKSGTSRHTITKIAEQDQKWKYVKNIPSLKEVVEFLNLNQIKRVCKVYCKHYWQLEVPQVPDDYRGKTTSSGTFEKPVTKVRKRKVHKRRKGNLQKKYF